MIPRKILEDTGIEIPDDASRFFTQGSIIIFVIPSVDEHGDSIVFREIEIEARLTDRQIESLKTANCYGDTGWTLT
jgi:hypothetical protein